MSESEVLSIGILIGLLFLFWAVSAKRRGKTTKPTTLDLSPSQSASHSPTSEPVAVDPSFLRELASGLTQYYKDSAHPEALLNHPKFQEGVEHLNMGGYSSQDLITYYHGDHAVAACMALEAYARRTDQEDIREKILANINAVVPWSRYFALRALSMRTPAGEPLVSKVLARIDPSWKDTWGTEFLREFIKIRLDGGEIPEFKNRPSSHLRRTSRVYPGGGRGPEG